jgi:hypothetical protein
VLIFHSELEIGAGSELADLLPVYFCQAFGYRRCIVDFRVFTAVGSAVPGVEKTYGLAVVSAPHERPRATVLVTFTVRLMLVLAAAGPSGTNKRAIMRARFNLISRCAFPL